MRGDKELDTYLKAQSWVAKHYRQIIIFSLAVAFFSIFAIFVMSIRFTNTVSKQSEAIKNLSNKVVLVRADGKVAILDKQEVSQTFLQSALRDLIMNYLILSGFDLRDVANFEDVAKQRKVERIVQYLGEGGKPGYKAFIEQIWRSYKADNLPEIIWVNEAADEIAYQDMAFKYSAVLPATVYYVKYQRWNEGKGSIVVYLEGSVDISRSSPENPLGILIDKLEVRQYVVKE